MEKLLEVEKLLNGLESKFLITGKNCPIPGQRDVILWAWETMKPDIQRVIEQHFVEKKLLKKELKKLIKIVT